MDSYSPGAIFFHLLSLFFRLFGPGACQTFKLNECREYLSEILNPTFERKEKWSQIKDETKSNQKLHSLDNNHSYP